MLSPLIVVETAIPAIIRLLRGCRRATAARLASTPATCLLNSTSPACRRLGGRLATDLGQPFQRAFVELADQNLQPPPRPEALSAPTAPNAMRAATITP